jgi:hypothetical protein
VKLADAKVQGTMWEGDVNEEVVPLDVEEVERLFCVPAVSQGSAPSSEPLSPVAKTRDVVSLLEPRTANNVRRRSVLAARSDC